MTETNLLPVHWLSFLLHFIAELLTYCGSLAEQRNQEQIQSTNPLVSLNLNFHSQEADDISNSAANAATIEECSMCCLLQIAKVLCRWLNLVDQYWTPLFQMNGLTPKWTTAVICAACTSSLDFLYQSTANQGSNSSAHFLNLFDNVLGRMSVEW